MRNTNRLTLRETIERNQAQIAGMCALVGKPKPEFKVELKPKQTRTKSINAAATEAQILKSILKYLALRKEVAWAGRFNSGMFAEEDRFIQANSVRGCSDIIGQLTNGKILCLEVKSKTGRIAPHQQAFIDRVNENHGIAAIVRSIEDVQIILDKDLL